MTVLYFNGGTYYADPADCVNIKNDKNVRFLCKNCGSKVGKPVQGLIQFTIYNIVEPITVYPRSRPVCRVWNCENVKCIRRCLSLALLGRLFIVPKKRILQKYADVPISVLSYCPKGDSKNVCSTIENYERVEYQLFKKIIDSGIYEQPKNYPLLREHLAATNPIYDVPKSMENHEVIYDIPKNIPIDSVIEAINSVVQSVTIENEKMDQDNGEKIEKCLPKNIEKNIIEMEKSVAEIIDLTSPCGSTCSTPRLVICESPEPIMEPRISVRKDLFPEKLAVSSPDDGQIPSTSWRKEKIFEGEWLKSGPSNVLQGKI